jgi:AcrR family transcriptional regulator
MIEVMTGTETRAERKERTRRAILDAALGLTEDSSLVALSLRQVARQVGIVPTAFYRHFSSIEELGLALVDESFESLRAMFCDSREVPAGVEGQDLFLGIVDNSVDALVANVRTNDRHFRFIARERVAGPAAVREAVQHQLELVERELATDIARVPGTEAWSPEDLRVLANLIVTAMVAHAETLANAGGRKEAERRVAERARTQLRLVLIGAFQWASGTWPTPNARQS